jgi:hypothetical protein
VAAEILWGRRHRAAPDVLDALFALGDPLAGQLLTSTSA